MTTTAPAARALVVCESMFGNTRAIAEAIGEELAERFAVTVTDVTIAPTTIDDIDLLVVGGSTHAWGTSRPRTRAAAMAKGATGRSDRGVREWLADITQRGGGPTRWFADPGTAATRPFRPHRLCRW